MIRWMWLALPLALNAMAHQDATGIVKERMDRFEDSKAAVREMRGLLKAGDTQAVSQLATQLAQWGAEMPEYFPEDSNPAPSEALDDIWLDWEGFVAAAEKFEQAAQQLADTPTGGNLQALGKTCKACHNSYRE